MWGDKGGDNPTISVPSVSVPVSSVNNKTGAVELTAQDVGAETPTGHRLKRMRLKLRQNCIPMA
jgi:hypothetical protein